MPIIPRRQLQLMLDELGPWLTRSKALDLIARLDNVDPDQAIPAEYELAIEWGFSAFCELEIDPSIGGRVPDFKVANAFPGQDAVIEITALSDDQLSGDSAMERTANIINQFADTVRAKASKHLYYTFGETSGYTPKKLPKPIGSFTHQSQYYRKRLVSRTFALNDEIKASIRTWLASWPPQKPLHIGTEDTSLHITWKERVHPHSKTFSSMPSEAHDLKKNPIYVRLKEKEKQLADAPAGTLKCIMLGDSGCRLLREPKDFDGTKRRVSGESIIYKFLSDSDIDIVCIFTPRRRHENGRSDPSNPRLWHLYTFDKYQRPPGFYASLEKLRDLLPKPYLHAYQARSWMEQGFLGPQTRGQYLPLTYSGGAMTATVKVSARALLEYLAGRIDHTQLKHWVVGDDNPFERFLGRGLSISSVEMETTDAEKDDDYIVMKMELDPNASPLRLPEVLLAEKKS